MLQRAISGQFHAHELRKYLIFKTIVFWGLIGTCWLAFPAENSFSIMRHTFSFLGSFQEEHNPQWWWIFSVAMLFWAVAMLPTTRYLYHRFAAVSRTGAAVGAGLFLVGSIGIAIVALFPDSPDLVFGAVRWTEIHEKGAVMCFAGFVLGIGVFGVLLLRDRAGHVAHRGLLWPYVLWCGMLGTAAANQIYWGITYEAMKREAVAAGRDIRSSWGESLNTIYAFPLWENLVIYVLFVFIVWFTLATLRSDGTQVNN